MVPNFKIKPIIVIIFCLIFLAVDSMLQEAACVAQWLECWAQ
jgi:hypothetical protein